MTGGLQEHDGCMTRGIQDCRKGGMKGRRDEEKKGFRSGKNQDWRDT